LHHHCIDSPVDRKRRDDEEPGLAAHLPVVEEHGAIREPAAAQDDAPIELALGVSGAAGKVLVAKRRQDATRLEPLVQRDLLCGAVELPEAKPQRQPDPKHRGQKDPGGTTALRCSQRLRPGAAAGRRR